MTDLLKLFADKNDITFTKQFNAMLEGMGLLVDHHFSAQGISPLEGLYDGFVPATDIYIEEDNRVIEMEVPGLGKDDVTISVLNGMLKISGEKERTERKETTQNISCEIVSGRFERQFSLDSSEIESADKIFAIFKNGILKVYIPIAKREKEPRNIDIVSEE